MEPKTKTRDSWLTAAFSALAEGGVDQVRIELLAKKLKVTKGSFYWHFRDRTELLDALLDSWKQGRIAAIKEQTRLDGREPTKQLHDLLALYNGSNPRGMAIELAVRDWARRAPEAEGIIAEVDRERLRCVGDLFAALGLPPDQSFARAYLFYAFAFGQGLLASNSAAERAETVRTICGAVLVPERVGS
ncbi:TetR/AcrR family transcriptional regulator [Azospirillum doebereinerae]|uniref:TetR/AcrR family transcriptional regulator n=1 Tax=Azospirillum doebereinerae TaxID=92933 RepID=A0A3S0XJ51_9PROT|nr:TetR/AcrR family transcriptional regulator [Azospirillum doebereinerae]MCG5243661.1 TetR/AcrR family transcriptional regulator [Azospirillum doebereinerae]RUQ64525.1 TetR/AcrR family transcriptional regulator [Azospirillum doebereinerae]